MSKEKIEYTIKTDRNTGEVLFSRGDYSFKQWGLRHEIIDLIDNLQQENKQLKHNLDKYKETIAKFKDLETLIGTLHSNNLRFSFNEILHELESSDINE